MKWCPFNSGFPSWCKIRLSPISAELIITLTWFFPIWKLNFHGKYSVLCFSYLNQGMNPKFYCQYIWEKTRKFYGQQFTEATFFVLAIREIKKGKRLKFPRRECYTFACKRSSNSTENHVTSHIWLENCERGYALRNDSRAFCQFGSVPL